MQRRAFCKLNFKNVIANPIITPEASILHVGVKNIYAIVQSDWALSGLYSSQKEISSLQEVLHCVEVMQRTAIIAKICPTLKPPINTAIIDWP